MGADLVQLVADIEDRGALGGQFLQGREQDLGLLRGQHAGGFVHDQQLRLAQQAAHDFHPLAFARRQGFDASRRVQRQAIGGADLADAARQIGAARRRIHPQRDVFRHGQRVEQAEMLEHHANARRPRRMRVRRRMGGALQPHPPLVRADQPVDRLDQSRFSGAIFAQKRVDFPRSDAKRHVVVRTHARIGFRQALGPEQFRCCHAIPVVFLAG